MRKKTWRKDDEMKRDWKFSVGEVPKLRVERTKFGENLPTNERRRQEADGGAGDKRHQEKTKRRKETEKRLQTGETKEKQEERSDRKETQRTMRGRQEIKAAGSSVCMLSVSHCSAWMNCSDNAEVSVGERRWERQSEDGHGGRERERARRDWDHFTLTRWYALKNRWIWMQILPAFNFRFSALSWVGRGNYYHHLKNNRWDFFSPNIILQRNSLCREKVHSTAFLSLSKQQL